MAHRGPESAFSPDRRTTVSTTLTTQIPEERYCKRRKENYILTVRTAPQAQPIRSLIAETDTGELLLQAQQLVSMNKPAARDQQSVQCFLENGSLVDGQLLENGSLVDGQSIRPLLQGDTEFVYHKEDLVTLRPGRESAWLDALVERLLKVFHCRAIQVSITPLIGLSVLIELAHSKVYILQQGESCPTELAILTQLKECIGDATEV